MRFQKKLFIEMFICFSGKLKAEDYSPVKISYRKKTAGAFTLYQTIIDSKQFLKLIKRFKKYYFVLNFAVAQYLFYDNAGGLYF